jgi:hypothetical protein
MPIIYVSKKTAEKGVNTAGAAARPTVFAFTSVNIAETAER